MKNIRSDHRATKTMSYRTADLVDQYGDLLQVCEAPLKSYGKRRDFHGPVSTVKCYEDNALIRKVLSTPGETGVLVVDGGGSLRTALMGDMIAQLACDNGWAGIVIWGAVRDVRTLATLDIGIMAGGSNPRKSTKTGVGEIGVPLEFGAVIFQPGMWLSCDEDGIVIGSHDFNPTNKS